MYDQVTVVRKKAVIEETETHQSRWGFHPCSYETYLKLKFLNKFYVKGLRQIASWERWNRKMPHNRLSIRYNR